MTCTLSAPPVRSLWTRRNAFRLAATVVPAAAAIAVPALSGNAYAAGASTTAGYTKPNEWNTGVWAGSALTKVVGDIYVTTPGTVIENKDIYGFVRIRAANVVIRNCRVRGSGPGGFNTGLIDCNHPNAKNALIEDCTLVPDTPSVWLDGVIGKEYTARRCNVSNVVDGFGVYNASNRSAPANVRIESCYIHDLSYFANDPNHGGGPTHNDGIQIQGGSNIVIRGNNIQAYLSPSVGNQNYADKRLTQGILIQPNLALVTNSDISYNWLDGGKVCLYFVLGSRPSQHFGTCTGNRFGTDQYNYGGGSKYQIRVKTGVTFSNALTSNVWDDGGTAFSVARTGGIRYDA